MKREPTPEEKLLRLIRRKEPSSLESAQPAPSPLTHALRGGPAAWLFQMSVVNRLLIGVILLFLGYLVYDTFLRKSEEPSAILYPSETPAGEEAAVRTPPAEEGLQIGPRDIFKAPAGGAGAMSAPQGQEEAAPDLALLGVISGERPQAIIEDRKSKKTHFLYEGDTMGQLRVSEIKEGKVILEYQGKQIELIL